MTKQELIAAQQAAAKAETRRLLKVFVVLGICFVAMLVGVQYLTSFIESDAFLAFLPSIQRSSLFGMASLGCLIFATLILIAAVSEANSVKCPLCSRGLLKLGYLLANITGRCCRCGEKIVDDCDWKPAYENK